MRQKKAEKRWSALALTAIMTVGLLLQPMQVQAAETKNGTFHIKQFGEYDVNAAVSVDGGKIAGVDITGENFGGTYADVNRSKLAKAVAGIADKLVGKSSTDAAGIAQVDAVSGATISSNAIKSAVKDALDLREEEQKPSDVPSQIPEAGTYDITVAVRSDVVDHSLVQEDTAKAVLQVEEDGTMQLAYTMVSGTSQEPMYILGFNGYYVNNDPSQGLSTEGVTYDTEQRGDYTVVTNVSFPLSGLSQYYYNNTYLYVPVMGNLNGEVGGVVFDHGKFNIKTIVTMHWDTLQKAGGTTDTSTKDMQISAQVTEGTSTPEYTVSVPAAVTLGTLKSTRDNVVAYDVAVDKSNVEGSITVTAPEEGLLYNGTKTLTFYNDFGEQVVNASETQVQLLAADEENTVKLPGTILIPASEIKKASAGNYAGTQNFTITYSDKEIVAPDPSPTPSPSPTPTPSPSPSPTPSPADEPLDVQNLADGVYSVTGSLVKADKTTASMADNAINHTIKLTVKNGKYYLTLNFKGMTIGDKLGYLGQMKYFTTGYTLDQYGNPTGNLADATVESYQKNTDGSLVSDEYGTNYPDTVTLELIQEARKDGYAPLQVNVPVMESIASGMGLQTMFLKLDWTTLKKTTDTDTDFDDGNTNNGDNGTNSGGSTLNGGSTLSGGSSLSGSGLNSGSSLKSSALTKASGAKTGDEQSTAGYWIIVSIAVAATFLVVFKRKNSKNQKQQEGKV
ncbi:MAG: NEAT domain-containing protein [Lachnospiraceae bacterium]|nr:NEAT domain-containing protein [Lachnospiraceae bacterium]